MMRRLTIVLLAALACGVSRAGDAEPLEDAFWGGDITTLNSIVVTGTRTPRLLKETPVQTRVISREEILKADATNIQDLLQTELPGVEFTYAMNQQVTMNLSGFSGLGILFLVDGEPLAGETLDNIDFTRLSMNDVDRVEIVQGATSALYGSSAAGGVINIITRQDTVPWTLHADGRYAHHNQQRYNLRQSLRQGLYAHTLTFSRTSSDGYDVHNAEGAADARTFSHVFGDDTWQAGYRMQLDPTDNLRLGGRLGFFRRTVDRAADMPERYYDYTAGLRGEWTVSERDRLEASWSCTPALLPPLPPQRHAHPRGGLSLRLSDEQQHRGARPSAELRPLRPVRLAHLLPLGARRRPALRLALRAQPLAPHPQTLRLLPSGRSLDAARLLRHGLPRPFAQGALPRLRHGGHLDSGGQSRPPSGDFAQRAALGRGDGGALGLHPLGPLRPRLRPHISIWATRTSTAPRPPSPPAGLAAWASSSTTPSATRTSRARRPTPTRPSGPIRSRRAWTGSASSLRSGRSMSASRAAPSRRWTTRSSPIWPTPLRARAPCTIRAIRCGGCRPACASTRAPR